MSVPPSRLAADWTYAQASLADDGGRVARGEPAARRAAAVGVHHPRRLARAVEHVVVVKPLDLVVQRLLLGQRRLPPGREIEHVEAPHRWVVADGLLVADARLVGRERRALDVLVDRPPGAPPQAGLDQPRPVARGHRRVERVAVAGERDAPEVAVARGERLAVDRDREVLLQVAELLRVDHVDDRRGGGELADVGVRVAAHERRDAAVAPVGRYARAARDAGEPDRARLAERGVEHLGREARRAGGAEAQSVAAGEVDPLTGLAGEQLVAGPAAGGRRERELAVVARALAVQAAEEHERAALGQQPRDGGPRNGRLLVGLAGVVARVQRRHAHGAAGHGDAGQAEDDEREGAAGHVLTR